MTKEAFFRILEKYNQGTASEQERHIIDDYCERVQITDIAREWDLSRLEESKLRMFDRITQAINKNEAPLPTDIQGTDKQGQTLPKQMYTLFWKYAKAWQYAAAGAAVFILILGWILASGLQTQTPHLLTKATRKGERLTVTLSDGTMVRLNASSSITYPESFEDLNLREVDLKGEAYFEVAPNKAKPFVVHTKEVKTTVVGTSFNVQAYAGESVQVTVTEGKVEVARSWYQSTGNNKVQLIPNQQAVYQSQDKSLESRQVNASIFTAWKDNVLVFDELPLKEVIRRMERWYGVDIRLTNQALGECVVVGSYHQKSLEEVLKAFSFVLRIEYEINQNQVIIRGGGCGSS